VPLDVEPDDIPSLGEQAFNLAKVMAFMKVLHGINVVTQQVGQAIPQGGPAAVRHIPGLHIKAVGEPVGGQHITVTIEDATPDRVAGHQPDAVVVGSCLVLNAVGEL
jgi:hypothetical protein